MSSLFLLTIWERLGLSVILAVSLSLKCCAGTGRDGMIKWVKWNIDLKRERERAKDFCGGS